MMPQLSDNNQLKVGTVSHSGSGAASRHVKTAILSAMMIRHIALSLFIFFIFKSKIGAMNPTFEDARSITSFATVTYTTFVVAALSWAQSILFKSTLHNPIYFSYLHIHTPNSYISLGIPRSRNSRVYLLRKCCLNLQ